MRTGRCVFACGTPVDRVSRRDQAGNQRAGEGPIGYRSAPTGLAPRPGTTAPPLPTVDQWRSFLDEETEGADEERITALEQRLGTRLPPTTARS